MENYEKKYEKLVDAVKVLRDNNPSDEGIQNWVNDNVPELKQSEDERIRKAILWCIRTIEFELGCKDVLGLAIDKLKSWIEKQGKSKFESCIQEGDKIVTNDDGTRFNISQLKRVAKKEPKFNVGDWVVREYTKYIITINQVVGVKRIDDEHFAYTLDDETYFSGSWESYYHLWTIKDAKDGDVLVHNGYTFIFKGIKNGMVQAIDEDFDTHPVNYGESEVDDYHPATKEQRDLLFQKMKEAGYEWDVEKKELRKIE